MALNITINKVAVAASFAAGATVATAVASGGTTYTYSLATGSNEFSINSTTGVVTVKVLMDSTNIKSFSITATSETDTITSEVVHPNVIADIQNYFSEANMIYKITKDINLNSCVLTIPNGCTLDFQGGTFSNGTIYGNKTKLSNPKILSITLNGTYIQFGITSNRPTVNTTGDIYFDTSISKPIWWNGNKWVDSSGIDASIIRKGTTAQRPNLTSTDSGFQYYDTILSKYIFWNGTAWVNMDGTALI